MLSTKNLEKKGVSDRNDMRIPVVGYTGHRMGYKSQNFYGKNFRDCAIQSRFVHQMAQKWRPPNYLDIKYYLL